jgi:disulfide bond formation protein DsbB
MIQKIKEHKITDFIYKNADYGVWFIAIASVFGSLTFSEILKFQPCQLCWWQRILMYPLAIFLSVAILRKDTKNTAYYVLPFGLIGMIVSFYHSLLQWGVIKETVLNCTENGNVACDKPDFLLLGFVTIPFLSFLAFTAITALMSLKIWLDKK